MDMVWEKQCILEKGVRYTVISEKKWNTKDALSDNIPLSDDRLNYMKNTLLHKELGISGVISNYVMLISAFFLLC